MKKYYAVTTKCGHVGKGKFINVTFAICAEDGKEAAEIGRWLPRVKHHYKYCITDVKCISYDNYLELCEENNNNPYLKCKNVQEQNETCPNIYDNVETLDYLIQEPKKVYKEKRKQRVEFILKKKKIIQSTQQEYLEDHSLGQNNILFQMVKALILLTDCSKICNYKEEKI